jgi:hypothetical protein
MTRKIMYRYDSWTEGCGCCSNSSSTYDVYEEGTLVSEDNWCTLCCDEEDLRECLKHLEPFDVDPDSWWF